MAFKPVLDLDSDITTALGGRNKKTGKANPTQVEGHYIGSRKVESKKAKSGYAFLHILSTAQGNLGVWGKTDLDRKMAAVPTGAMIRITQSGTVPTPNGEMYKFKVEVDSENTIDVELSTNSGGSQETYDTDSGSEAGETSLDADDSAADDIDYTPPKAPAQPARAADATAQKRVQDLLNRRRSNAA